MISGKKILKRTLGGLKMAAIYGPFVVLGGGAIASLGLGITSGVRGGFNNMNEDYKKSDTFITEYINDNEKLKEQLENGEIAEVEYYEALGKMTTNEYVSEVMSRDIEGNKEWQAKLKTNKSLGIAAMCCAGAAIAGGLVALYWLKNVVSDRIFDSAMEDLKWQPAEKPKKIQKEIAEEKQEDLSSDDENLGSLDEFLENFQK